jgi:hypothetical protein
MYSARNFLIISVDELDKVDFNHVMETSAETVRRSVDGTKTFIKWEGEEPYFLSDLDSKEGPYTYEEILEILAGSEWTSPIGLSMSSMPQ